METKKNILVVTSTYPTFLPWDATPAFVHELTNRLAQKWLDISVLAPRRPGTSCLQSQDGVRIWRYAYFFTSKRELLANGAIMANLKKQPRLYLQIPFLLLSCFFSLSRIVKKEKIETLHAHRLFPSGFLCSVYKKFFNPRIRVITTAHGSDVHSLSGWIMDRIKKRTLSNSDQVTVVSRSLQAQLDQLMNEQIPSTVISMGVDQEIFHPRNTSPELKKTLGVTGKLLLFVGRLAEEKWVGDLIDAMVQVKAQLPDCLLVIIGNGPLEDKLKALVVEKNLHKNIHFLGALPNHLLPVYYATADLCIMPSYKEWSPVVLLEALFSGTSCVARRIPQIEEVVAYGADISLFDTIPQLAEQIVERAAVTKPKTALFLENYTRDHVSLAFYHLIAWKR
jgi:glycosyltransferase involved in cell wall biosynthesis